MDGVALVGAKLNFTNARTVGRSAYHTKSHSSEVDETLFGNPQRHAQQVETKRISETNDWEPPWSTGPTIKGTPLLWTPFDHRGLKGRLSPRDGTPVASPRPSTPRSKNRYKKKNGGSYVDETLFGPNLKEAMFPPPWDPEESKGKPLMWSPQAVKIEVPDGEDEQNQRPGSRLGIYADPYIPLTPRTPRGTEAVKAAPVIQSRAGSNIKTPRGVKSAKVSKNGNPSNDEIIERALKIAQESRNINFSSRQSNDGGDLSSRQSPRTPKPAWGRPLSASSSRGYRRSVKSALPKERANDTAAHNPDFLTATGIKIPFTARNTRPQSSTPGQSPRRPSSARGARTPWK